MRHARAPVMSDNSKLAEAQALHHFHLILSHHALGVRQVFRVTGRFPAIAIATKVGTDHCKSFGKDQRYAMPAGVRLWVTVQKQDWSAFASLHEVYDRFLRFYLLMTETIK